MKTFVEFDDLREMYRTPTALEVRSRDLKSLKDVPGFLDAGSPPPAFRFFEAEDASSATRDYSPWHVRADGVRSTLEYLKETLPSAAEIWRAENPLRSLFNAISEKLGLGRPLADERLICRRIDAMNVTLRQAHAAGTFQVAETERGTFAALVPGMVVYNDVLDATPVTEAKPRGTLGLAKI